MRALVLQHIPIEGPGMLAPFLEKHGWEVEIAALYAGVRLPEQPHAYQAIIVMGGPMGVYDEEEYPFLREEHTFLRLAIAQDVPLLGICLGSQLLAKALGARVYQNRHKEIGWYTVDLTPAGLDDPLFMGIPSPVRVFQWHGDAFELPVGATALASSTLCTHQAFRYGDRVYGLLFHVELTPEIIRSWVATFQDELVSLHGQIDPERIVADIPHYIDHYQHIGAQIFANLLNRLWRPVACQNAARQTRT